MPLFQSIFSDVWSVALAILLLGLTIFVHELGHFLAARKRGMKVERFSIGFGPKIYGWTGKDGVEYRLSWIPLGGYVALPQLADMAAIEGESQTPVEKLPPISCSTKIIVAVAGPLFNVIFAFILATVVWIAGQQVPSEAQGTVIGGVRGTMETSDGKTIPGPAAVAGLKAGDSIVAVDGKAVASFESIYENIALGSGRDANGQPRVSLTVKRGEATFDVDVLPAYVTAEKFRDIGIVFPARIVVEAISPDSAAAAAGLKAGDMLLQIDGQPILSVLSIRDHLATTKAAPVTITYERDGKIATTTATPRLTTNPETKTQSYLLGVAQDYVFTYITVHVSPWAQVSSVVTRSWRMLGSLINPRSDINPSKMSGPIEIIRTMARSAKSDGAVGVIVFMVLINISLAFLNLLPIPVLDGGHILFAIITKIKGSPLPARFVMTSQSICMVLLFSLMIYVCFSDVRRIVRDSFSSKPAPAQQAPAPAK